MFIQSFQDATSPLPLALNINTMLIHMISIRNILHIHSQEVVF